jgi:ribosome-associated translation inhibitor RaiA
MDTDMFASIDKVCTRIEKTLRRHKEKTKTHRIKNNIKSSDFVSDETNEERGES